MPPPVCNKCRSTSAAEGDSWCLGCSCWEALGRELSGSWDSPGARLLASDLVVNCARQVRALRSLSAGLARQEGPKGSAGSAVARSRDPSRGGADHRSSLPRRRSREAAPAKEEQESEEDENSETDEEEKRQKEKKRSRTRIRKTRGGDRPPPEPEDPPTGLSSIGRTLSDGKTFDIDDKEGWRSLSPETGTVIEVQLAGTQLPVTEELWGAFFIMEVEHMMDGSIYLQANFMGAEGDGTSALIEIHWGGFNGPLHLCVSRPCVEVPEEGRGPGSIHVTVLRLWTIANFEADYVTDEVWGNVKKWQAALKRKAAPKRTPRKPAMKQPPKGAGTKPRAREEKPKSEEKDKTKRSKADREKAREAGLTEEQRDKLKARLKDIRRKHHEVGEEDEPEEVPSDSEEVGSSGAEEGSSGYAPTEPLATGANMKEIPKKSHGRVSKGPTEKVGAVVPYKGSNDASTKTWSGQLAQQALAVSRARTSDQKKRKKTRGGGALHALKDALRSIVGKDDKDRKDKKEKKDKKKKKKDKKRRRRIENGVIRSSSDSSGSTSTEKEDEEDESSTSDLEAPMKKKSREKPGSILALLVEHVRAQMEQDAVLEVPDAGRKVTGGVLLPPAHQKRLRISSKGVEGDVHSGFGNRPFEKRRRCQSGRRYVSPLHSHPSVAPRPELGGRPSHGALPIGGCRSSLKQHGPSHPKAYQAVQRVQGKGNQTWSTWGGKGRGRGKGDWSYGGEGSGKGKKGKQESKGKGKGKPWNNQDRASQDWAKTQEKPDATK
eukprot:s868_g16.t1